MEYRIVATRDHEDLAAQVNAEIKNGWKPFGPLMIENFSDTPERYFQAMIKDEPASAVDVTIKKSVDLVLKGAALAPAPTPAPGGGGEPTPKTSRRKLKTRKLKTARKSAKKGKAKTGRKKKKSTEGTDE